MVSRMTGIRAHKLWTANPTLYRATQRFRHKSLCSIETILRKQIFSRSNRAKKNCHFNHPDQSPRILSNPQRTLRRRKKNPIALLSLLALNLCKHVRFVRWRIKELAKKKKEPSLKLKHTCTKSLFTFFNDLTQSLARVFNQVKVLHCSF